MTLIRGTIDLRVLINGFLNWIALIEEFINLRTLIKGFINWKVSICEFINLIEVKYFLTNGFWKVSTNGFCRLSPVQTHHQQ